LEELKAHIEANFKPGHWFLQTEAGREPLVSISSLGEFLVLKRGGEGQPASTFIVSAHRLSFLYEVSGTVQVKVD
jgi:hypothetical protein